MSLIILRRLTVRHSYCASNVLCKRIQRLCSDDSSPPQKPKQPPGIFTIYYHEQTDKFLQKDTGMNQSQLIQRIGEEWKAASEQERDVYRDKFLKLMENYKEELLEFEDSLTDDERVSQTLQDEKESARSRKRIDFSKPLEFPRRPLSAFGYFLRAAKELYAKQPNQTDPQWINEMAHKWHTMNEEEKQKYREAGRRSYQKFEERKEDWESVFSLDEVGGFVRR